MTGSAKLASVDEATKLAQTAKKELREQVCAKRTQAREAILDCYCKLVHFT